MRQVYILKDRGAGSTSTVTANDLFLLVDENHGDLATRLSEIQSTANQALGSANTALHNAGHAMEIAYDAQTIADEALATSTKYWIHDATPSPNMAGSGLEQIAKVYTIPANTWQAGTTVMELYARVNMKNVGFFVRIRAYIADTPTLTGSVNILIGSHQSTNSQYTPQIERRLVVNSNSELSFINTTNRSDIDPGTGVIVVVNEPINVNQQLYLVITTQATNAATSYNFFVDNVTLLGIK